ncbi:MULTISPECIES: hypothetical protein [Kamptonema]|uniref:hypothetical protein n=1 Tax=Kamptonema TaxID=1501433 RepID=UPI000376EDD5|nr:MULTISPECIES: hypothetical protein [Kamptonema]
MSLILPDRWVSVLDKFMKQSGRSIFIYRPDYFGGNSACNRLCGNYPVVTAASIGEAIAGLLAISY